MFPSKQTIFETCSVRGSDEIELSSITAHITKPENAKTTSVRLDPNGNSSIHESHQNTTYEVIDGNDEDAINGNNDPNNDQDEESKIHYPDGGWQAYSVVLGSFFSCFTLFGLMNGMGAIESYIQQHQLKDNSVSSVSWVFSIYMFVSLFMGAIVGPLYDTFGCTWLLAAGTTFIFVGLFTCGMCVELYQFVLSFGVCCGLGTGLMMFPAISSISTWFSKSKRSFWIGLAQCGGSVGGVCFPIMLRSLYPKYGFNWAMRIFAFLNLGVDVLGIVLTRDRLKEINRADESNATKITFLEKMKGCVDLEFFKEKPFLMLSVALFFNEFSLLIALTYLSSYAIAQGATQSQSYIMLTILNTAGTFGKFIPSYFANTYGNFNMMTLMSFSMTLEIFLIWLPFGKYTAALYVFIVLFGFSFASTYSLTGACVSTTTKNTRDFGKRFGSAYAFVSFGNLISLPISSSVIKSGTPADYNKMVAFAAATCLAGTVSFIMARSTIVGFKVKTVV